MVCIKACAIIDGAGGFTLSGHPWILSYTELPFKTLSIRSKTKNQGAATSCQLANALVFVSPGNQVGVGSPEEDLNQHPSIV
ncbi:hypothetical protein NC651_013678 [Populus alba x Populus x berolinensis]|nr:hypothetical protein NC651_013678 [Populus alba x Populus x berolinensis]